MPTVEELEENGKRAQLLARLPAELSENRLRSLKEMCGIFNGSNNQDAHEWI